MNPKLDMWFDEASKRTKYALVCRRCGHRFHVCTTPQAAHRAGVKKGYDLDTGLCRTCRVMDNMAVLIEKRSVA
jgi:transcription elongation factor Elf1